MRTVGLTTHLDVFGQVGMYANKEIIGLERKYIDLLPTVFPVSPGREVGYGRANCKLGKALNANNDR